MWARILFFVSILAFSVEAGAAPVRQPSSLGLGFLAGSPTALSLKYWLGGSDAIDLAVGAGPGLRVHGDYLWGIAQLLPNTRSGQLDLYLGAGAILGTARGWCGWYGRGRDRFCHGDPYIGMRVPVGLDFRLRQAPLSFGLEIAPGIAVSSHYAGGLVDAAFFARVVL